MTNEANEVAEAKRKVLAQCSDCEHCGVPIETDKNGKWYHTTGPGQYCDFGGEQYTYFATPRIDAASRLPKATLEEPAKPQVPNDLCEFCHKDAAHLGGQCPMKDASPNDKPCKNCGSPVYYSFGSKVWAHEGHQPSLKHRLPTRGDWGKWTNCENSDGTPMGTKAERVAPAPAAPLQVGEERKLPELDGLSALYGDKWMRDAAAKENGCFVSVGGLIADLSVNEDENSLKLKHAMNCAAWHNDQGDEVNGGDCTCGFRYRIQEQTEKTMHSAWRKRAEEAELERDAALKENAALRFRIHIVEEHNQHFVRCESAWCHPSEHVFGNPALETFKGCKERAEQAEAALAKLQNKYDLLSDGSINLDLFAMYKLSHLRMEAWGAAYEGIVDSWNNAVERHDLQDDGLGECVDRLQAALSLRDEEIARLKADIETDDRILSDISILLDGAGIPQKEPIEGSRFSRWLSTRTRVGRLVELSRMKGEEK